VPNCKYSELAYQKYEHANNHILQYILQSGIKNPAVLDVGCWMGAFGEQLTKQMSCQIDGIDINQEVLEIAMTKGYRHIYQIDLNNADFSAISQKYDFIVLGDVLEHTIDPSGIICRLKQKLTATGRFAVSLPNVGFILYRILHLLGYWDYKEYGVMDKTHLRFFTLDSMKKFFSANQLQITQNDPHIGLNRSAFVTKAALLLAKICPSLFATQIIFLLSPHERG
jgi:2-polyprenyl-3-methyl-5-hydroxy-6-metoxy-1,4-benzoquinol methylase